VPAAPGLRSDTVIVTDEQVERALAWMTAAAEKMGEALARRDDAYEDMKSVEALYITSEDCGVEKARALARRSQDYKDAKVKRFKWGQEYETLRRRWELAKIKIESVWKTEECMRPARV